MTRNSSLRSLLAFGIVVLATQPLEAQHGHLDAGAVGKNQNDRLIWANAADFVAGSGYVKTLDYTNSGRFAGYFQGGITPTALPATEANAGPDPDAAALGAYLQFRLSFLEGPPGGEFGFWETGSTAPSLSIGASLANTNLWRLSENDGAAGSDPFGHIHGRRFTATKPGVYLIGFQAVDTSTNGADAGPIHTPSEELPIRFQAGVNVFEVVPAPTEGGVRIRFGAPAGFLWQVEVTTHLAAAEGWAATGPPLPGEDQVVEVFHETAATQANYYRVKGEAFTP